MDTKTFIKSQFAAARRVCDAAMTDTTDEQFNWAPPGTANSMRATLVHIACAEDSFITKIVQGKPMVWETQEWSVKIGLAEPPGGGHSWDEVTKAWLDQKPVVDYFQAVRSAVDDYLASLTNEELDRKISWNGNEHSIGALLALVCSHTACHAGDLASIKGIQGVKGLPY